MKVAFDARAASDPRGIGRYVRCLLAALRETAGEHTIVESHRPARGQLFHAPWIDGASLRSRVPQVVTVHDLVPLKRRSEYLRTGLRFRLRYLAVQRAERVIVPTRAVAEDLTWLLDVPAERIRVIGEAAAACMRPRAAVEVAAVRERYGLPEDYLLWVGGLEHPDPRKRVAALARESRKLPLVLAGPAGRWARELPDVLLTGRLDDDELAAVYTGARALVFPSDDEGFGLPPVEALACGTPVAACDVPALREVLGDRAALVPVDDLAGLVAAAEAARRPAPLASTFSWEDAARTTWAVYEELVDR
ncbi:MAG: glycosyltransferase family 4 protein [Solirubrobacterales bacterium]|nr:glycosyltransferase family 4 protein [Solirubrobacterales bacterium]